MRRLSFALEITGLWQEPAPGFEQERVRGPGQVLELELGPEKALEQAQALIELSPAWEQLPSTTH